MFEFDIEDVKNDLEGMTILEKLEKVRDLTDELESAISEVQILQDELSEEYENSVCNGLSASVSALIKRNHWENLVTISEDDFTKTFTVNSKPVNARIAAIWNDDQWMITISNTEFIASNAKRYEAYANLAERLNLSYQQGKEWIQLNVEENELQPTIIRIITTLCE